jgi:serine/threonine protein kinase
MLGQGKFGRVYLARMVLTGLPVAIKSIPKTKLFEKKLRISLLREIAILQSLNHPNIIRILEVFESKAEIFIVTEHAPGGDLLTSLKDRGVFKEADWAVKLVQLAKALEYLDSQGIIHGDIKLENILLDDKGRVKLCDFGVSRRIDDRGAFNELTGTPIYSAPEMLRQQRTVGTTSDVWSLGVLSCIALTGQVPFKGDTINAILEKVTSDSPIFDQSSKISPRMQAIILKMLKKDPHSRILSTQVRSGLVAEGLVAEGDLEPFSEDMGERDAACLRSGFQKKSKILEDRLEVLETMGIPSGLARDTVRSRILNHVHALYSSFDCK